MTSTKARIAKLEELQDSNEPWTQELWERWQLDLWKAYGEGLPKPEPGPMPTREEFLAGIQADLVRVYGEQKP